MPAMTVANQISYAKRLARTTSNSLTESDTDDVVRQYINVGVDEFAKEGRLSKQEFVTVTPTFWGRTNWYAKITIVDSAGNNSLAATNVALVESDVDRISGSTMATHIATGINAAIGAGSISVSWDDNTWNFTIAEDTASNLTSISIEQPSVDNYVDGTEKTFGKTGTETSTSWTSNIPEDCTLESDLPSDFMEMEHADYDDHLLFQAPFDIMMSPEVQSNWPQYYAIRDRKIYIAPTPSDRRMLKIRYRYLPSPVALDGASDTATCLLPIENHMAPVYYAAGMILRETFEPEESDRMFGLYYDQVKKYRIRQNNQNAKIYPRNMDFFIPIVNSDSTVR
jgi:hypothetical protein